MVQSACWVLSCFLQIILDYRSILPWYLRAIYQTLCRLRSPRRLQFKGTCFLASLHPRWSLAEWDTPVGVDEMLYTCARSRTFEDRDQLSIPGDASLQRSCLFASISISALPLEIALGYISVLERHNGNYCRVGGCLRLR